MTNHILCKEGKGNDKKSICCFAIVYDKEQNPEDNAVLSLYKLCAFLKVQEST